MRTRNQSDILDEIEQIAVQYQAEVPGKRKAWPQSVKDRVLELKIMGSSETEISHMTGISVQTIWSWKLKRKLTELPAPTSYFLPVQIKPSTVTVEVASDKPVPIKRRARKKAQALTVVTPLGFRLEGLTLNQIVSVLNAMAGPE